MLGKGGRKGEGMDGREGRGGDGWEGERIMMVTEGTAQKITLYNLI